MTISNSKLALDIKIAFKKHFNLKGIEVKEMEGQLIASNIKIDDQCTYKDVQLALSESNGYLTMYIASFINGFSKEDYVELCLEFNRLFGNDYNVDANLKLINGTVVCSVITRVVIISKDSVVINEEVLGRYILCTISSTEKLERALSGYICK